MLWWVFASLTVRNNLCLRQDSGWWGPCNTFSRQMYLMKYGYMDHHPKSNKSAPLLSRDGLRDYVVKFQGFAGRWRNKTKYFLGSTCSKKWASDRAERLLRKLENLSQKWLWVKVTDRDTDRDFHPLIKPKIPLKYLALKVLFPQDFPWQESWTPGQLSWWSNRGAGSRTM